MINLDTQNTKIYSNPYKDLYIYYIQGRLKALFDNDAFIGNWEEDGFSFLFFSKPCDDLVYKVLKQEPELVLLDQYHMTYDEWQGGKLVPFHAGNFYIVPPWYSKNIPDNKIRIFLDPGVVFGTGTHTTTYDCLEMIAQVFKDHEIKTVIDIGTGTGLLALGAASFGSNVFALDFNLLAVKTAKRNFYLNNLEKKILAFQGRGEEFMDICTDMLIANIHYDVMKNLIKSKGFLEKKWFILSGLLRTQARDVASTLQKLPVEIIEMRARDGIWHTFLGRMH